MDLAEACVGPMVDAIYRRLIERDFALEDPRGGHVADRPDQHLGGTTTVGDRPTEVLLMAAYGERGVLDRPNMRVMRRRNGALSREVTWRMSLDWEVLGLTNQVRCQCPLSLNLG